MTEQLHELIDLLDLEQIEVNLFRGHSPDDSWQRVFGGQVIRAGAGGRIAHGGGCGVPFTACLFFASR